MPIRIRPSRSWRWPGATVSTSSKSCKRGTSKIMDDLNSPLPRIPRREAIRWMLTAAASLSALDQAAVGGPHKIQGTTEGTSGGYGTDPNLMKNYDPGDCWPLTFTEGQRKTAAALCDVIIPED